MLRAAPALVLLLAALGGCAGHPAPAPSPAVQPAPAPLHLQLSGCTGWQATSAPLPPQLAPGQAPPGWEPDPATLRSVLMEAYQCSRISLGAFERGPVRILLDAHDRAAVPPACLAQAPVGSHELMLAGLWVDDAEVAAFLNATYGMPVHAAQVREEAQPAAAGTLHTWTWGLPGQAASTLTVLDDGTRTATASAHTLLWQRGAGIGALQVADEREGLSPSFRPVHGELHAPMLLSGQPLGAFAGAGNWFSSASLDGTFRLYRDLACAQPEA